MKKLILSALMMSLCGSAFANVDFSHLKKGIIDCDHFQIEGNNIRSRDNQLVQIPQDKIKKAQAFMRFQDAMQQVIRSTSFVDDKGNKMMNGSLSMKYSAIKDSVTQSASDVLIEEINNYCGKSVDDFLQGTKSKILNILESGKGRSSSDKTLLKYYNAD